SDRLADDPDGMAAFSSRGPVEDSRYKPDVVAPGTFIISTRSSVASGTGWGEGNAYYEYMGGTSMATPLVAGATALVRQFYTDEEGITPSAALVKATLINGATDINPGQYGTGAGREIPGPRPTNVAGWGRVNIAHSIFPAAPRRLLYEDQTTGLNTGATDTYTYTVLDSSEPFQVTLVWNDYPASTASNGGLVNDLDLEITGPGGTYHPNGLSTADRVNNVENIDIASPQTGLYVVTVSAYNVPQGPQPYALVASGAITLYTAPPPHITAISPARGVNTGTVHVTLSGTGFAAGAAVKLTHSGRPDIVGSNVTVPSTTTLTCDFDLDGAPIGPRDVVVTNPDGQRGTLAAGFTILLPPAPDVTVDKSVVGSDFQPGDPVTFTLRVSNQGQKTAHHPVVSDPLPSEIVNHSWTSPLPITLVTGTSYRWNLPPLTVGAGVVITIYGRVANGSVGSVHWPVVNTASVSDPDDITPGNNTDSASLGKAYVYLPLILRTWPPVPGAATLNAIDNSDGDENYTVSWSAADRATTYLLQEATNSSFSNATTAYSGTATSVEITGQARGVTYYYRVQGHNSWGAGGWSNIQSVLVPELDPVVNGDFESGTYGWTEY
ncbi:MAG TPA: DUF11 domain-containing protein, partial [Anaerolineae bacterium]|nr:DUF11 domain-containing protein [Anaerolineae bacterium]